MNSPFAPSGKCTVLVVDDTPDNLSLMSDLLRTDYKVKLAPSGERALQIVAGDSKPDLILLDIMMPDMDGYEVLRRLQFNPDTELTSVATVGTSPLVLFLLQFHQPLVYILLAVLYESLSTPVIRMFSLPFGLIGSFVFLAITRNSINLYSLLGLLVMDGLVAKNGTLLLDYTLTLMHQGVEATDGPSSPGPRVTQVFCSALPVAYGRWPQQLWQEFAQLILDAAYEATLLAGVLNSRQGGSNIVLLTLLGGGAFGNAPEWIHTAIQRAISKTQGHGLDVRVVSYGQPSPQLQTFVKV